MADKGMIILKRFQNFVSVPFHQTKKSHLILLRKENILRNDHLGTNLKSNFVGMRKLA